MFGKHLLIDLASGNPSEGELQPRGYILQDIEHFEGIDLVCDIEELDEYLEKGQCKRIRASHCMEHFPTSHIPRLFKMMYDLLEKEGIFEIHVPNFLWHAELLHDGRDDEAVNYCFGAQRDQYDFHKTAFTPMILTRRLKEAGFEILDINVEHSIHVLAKKN